MWSENRLPEIPKTPSGEALEVLYLLTTHLCEARYSDLFQNNILPVEMDVCPITPVYFERAHMCATGGGEGQREGERIQSRLRPIGQSRMLT